MRTFHRRYDYLVKELSKRMSLQDAVVVDCGCGDGDGTIHFAREKSMVVGIDLDKKRIKVARTAFPQLDFRVKSLLNTGLPNEYADIFVCSETLEHLSRFESLQASKEISRVCKSSAYVCITVPDNKKMCLEKKGHKQYLSQKTIMSHFLGWKTEVNSVFYKNPNKKRGNRVMIFSR